MRDDVIGGSMPVMLSANGTKLFPLYKPNTSYVRSVKYGGETVEYPKNMLMSFDPTVTKFEYFAYKPYTTTGALASNLLSNSDFTTDASLWTPSADVG